METEIWKDIEGFEGYQVSNFARIRKYDNFSKYPKILFQSPHRNRDGKPSYYCVGLRRNGVNYTKHVHRLVAGAFVLNTIGPDAVVQHVDRDLSNNLPSNLRWVTLKEAQARARSMAVCQHTKNGEFIQVFKSIRAAAKALGLNPTNIQRCIHGVQHTSGGFTWKILKNNNKHE